MLINSSLSAETAAANFLNGRTANAGAAPGNPAAGNAAAPLDSSFSPGAAQGVSLAELDGELGVQNSADADQAGDCLRANIFSQAGTALSAQANQNPVTVLGLLL
jgi:hypothetical protein